jgi:5-hmdU DNA kinase, helical domain
MNKAGIKRFFKFCRARHSIFLRREAGLPREEWTDDRILKKYKFTNVFRELDRTTAWFRHFVRDPMRDLPHVMLATVLFRMLNRIEVGEAIFCQDDNLDGLHGAFAAFADTGSTKFLKSAIKTYCGDGPYVTGAYIISSPAGYSKLDGVLKVVGDFYKRKCERPTCGAPDWLCCAERLIGHTHSLEQVWNWLREFNYFGNFHSYEIVTDLRHTRLLRDAPDKLTWCSPGPGARRGMNRVLGRDKDERLSTDELMDQMRELLKMSCDIDYWPQPHGDVLMTAGYEVFTHGLRSLYSQWPAWEMREVEHVLCEWDKYCRVKNGEGRPRSVYR